VAAWFTLLTVGSRLASLTWNNNTNALEGVVGELNPFVVCDAVEDEKVVVVVNPRLTWGDAGDGPPLVDLHAHGPIVDELALHLASKMYFCVGDFV